MLESITFKNDAFNQQNNEMLELTRNTIILFNNSKLKNEFVRHLRNGLDNDCNEMDYHTLEYKDVNYRVIMSYLPTTILEVDEEQKIILTVEAPFILQAKDVYDIHFVDRNDDNKICINALTDYVDFKEVWSKGIYKVYENVCNGVLGCYEGYGK